MKPMWQSWEIQKAWRALRRLTAPPHTPKDCSIGCRQEETPFPSLAKSGVPFFSLYHLKGHWPMLSRLMGHSSPFWEPLLYFFEVSLLTLATVSQQRKVLLRFTHQHFADSYSSEKAPERWGIMYKADPINQARCPSVPLPKLTWCLVLHSIWNGKVLDPESSYCGHGILLPLMCLPMIFFQYVNMQAWLWVAGLGNC